MPVKNTAKYLDACLSSILDQTYQDWELIAVDDHSTDKSIAKLEQYKYKDTQNRITVLPNDGKGIISALRTAYAQAKGDYITRMDSDDIMTPNKIQLFIERLREKGPKHIVTGLVEYFNDKGSTVGEGYRKYAAWLNNLTKSESNFLSIYKECPIASPNWMVHRQDFELSKAFLPDVYPEDYDLCFRFRGAGLKVTSIDEVTHKWRDYPLRTSRVDENYKDNRFTTIKINYFLQSDYEASKQLVLWGAGPKGKSIAKELISNDITFRWITDNVNKISRDIYGIILEDANQVLSPDHNSQYIIGISQRGVQEEIKGRLNTSKQKDVFFFC